MSEEVERIWEEMREYETVYQNTLDENKNIMKKQRN